MKTIIITGGAGGFGKLTAEQMAEKDYRVIIADVNDALLEETKNEIIKKTGNENILAFHLDLSSQDSVREFSDKIKAMGDPIDSLLCNAGVSSPIGTTKDGMDLVFEINYLGHFLLTLLLLPALTKDGRILLISSDMHYPLFGTMPWIGAEQMAYPDEELAKDNIRYCYSKLLMLQFVYKLTRKLKDAASSKVINGFNPGLMPTTGLLPNAMFTEDYLDMIRGMDQLGVVEENAVTIAALLTEDAYAGAGGLYYDRDRGPKKSSELSYDEKIQEEVWEYSLKLCKISEAEMSL